MKEKLRLVIATVVKGKKETVGKEGKGERESEEAGNELSGLCGLRCGLCFKLATDFFLFVFSFVCSFS